MNIADLFVYVFIVIGMSFLFYQCIKPIPEPKKKTKEVELLKYDDKKGIYSEFATMKEDFDFENM